MKKLLVLFLTFGVVFSSNAQRNKSNNNAEDAAMIVAGVAAGVAAAAYYEHQLREIVEQSAMEWALMNRPFDNGDKLEMKLMEWEVKAATDLSTTSTLLFKYRRNDGPY